MKYTFRIIKNIFYGLSSIWKRTEVIMLWRGRSYSLQQKKMKIMKCTKKTSNLTKFILTPSETMSSKEHQRFKQCLLIPFYTFSLPHSFMLSLCNCDVCTSLLYNYAKHIQNGFMTRSFVRCLDKQTAANMQHWFSKACSLEHKVLSENVL